MKGILITNNPQTKKKYADTLETVYLDNANIIEVLYYTRNQIHNGHKLLTHPLSGSVKPNQTPYKSIVITKEKMQLDTESLKIMEESIVIARKQIKEIQPPFWSKEVLEDFQLIDLALITSGIESMLQF